MLIIILVAIDQVIKYFMEMYKPRRLIIPGILELIYSKNTGTVFGLAADHNVDFMIVSLVLIVLLTILIYRLTKKYDCKRAYWGMILAGGIGNVIDRIYRGFVVDYLYIKPFGICNFADIVIVLRSLADFY